MTGAVHVRGLWKRFTLRHESSRSLKSLLMLGRGGRSEELWALRGVDLEVAPGESVALVGRNGSGKSTLLGILSRVYVPTRGEARAEGRIATLLELGAGFHPDLTGLENIYLNGSILGLSRREIDRRRDAIVSFAELEHFIDAPLRTYSSGMQMRLGFAVAVQMEPDVLLVDEVLAVGDEEFQQKCYARIAEFQRTGRTLLFVSHDLEAVRRVASRSVWLADGAIRQDGPTAQVLADYVAAAHHLDG